MNVCLIFLQDTDARKGAALPAAECLSGFLGEEVADLLPLAEKQEHLLTSKGGWGVLLVSIVQLRNLSSDSDLQLLLDLLMKMSLADGRYEHKENRLIHSLRELWDIHTGTADPRASWSILESMERGGDDVWTPVHDLAILYLGLAHRTDQTLTPDEVVAIQRKLGEWLPDALPASVTKIVADAMTAYSEGNHDLMVQASLEVLMIVVPVHQRKAVLSDLMFVARADNVVLVEEKEMISKLAIAWGVDPSEIS